MTNLDDLLDQATWAFYYGFGQAGRGLEAERGTTLDPRDQGKDQVGRKGDVDLPAGNRRAREAWQLTVRVVVDALQAVGVVVNRADVTDPRKLDYVLNALHRRFDQLPQHDRSQIATAMHRLDKAVGPHAAPQIRKPCDTCKAREKHNPTECTTCARYRTRTGDARPTSMDDEIALARLAQARRNARGEGWGNG